MKVFISWSGDRSRALAAILRDWLPMVVQSAQPWMSDVDIQAGERWLSSISGELESANFGILCLTPENVSSSWVLFEAGALGKSLSQTAVCPLLLDLQFSDLTGSPLAQFQAKKADKAGLEGLIDALNARTETPLPPDRLRKVFEALWSDFAVAIGTIPSSPTQRPPARAETEVLEDLVAAVRSLEHRFSADTRDLSPAPFDYVMPRSDPRFLLRLYAQFSARTVDSIAEEIGVSPEVLSRFLNHRAITFSEARSITEWMSKDFYAKVSSPLV